MKIAILGYSGSGKSTLAEHLGRHYKIPILYLDTVQFTAGWQIRGKTEAAAIVSAFMQQSSWVIDGNYTSFLQKERLEAADHIIFLNFNRFSCLIRALKRYFSYRGRSRKSMAENCPEKIDLEFLWWILYQSRTKDKKSHFQSIITQYPTKTHIIKSQHQLSKFYHFFTIQTGKPAK